MTATGTQRKRERTARSAALTGLFVLAAFYTLYFARGFFLPVTLAVLLSFLFGPVVRGLCRLHIPRVAAAAVVPVMLLAGFAYGAVLLSRPATEWLAQAPETLRQAEVRVRQVLQPATKLGEAANQVQQMTDSEPDGTPTVQVKPPGWSGAVLEWARGFAGNAVVTLVLLFFMLAFGETLLLRLSNVLPEEPGRRAIAVAGQIERTISTYLFSITLINAGLGTVVGVAMWLLGQPNPLFWGVMAALLNFVPYFGPLTGCLALVLAALMNGDTGWHIGLPALVYLGLHGIESNLITPAILGRRFTLNPLVIFLSLVLWGWMWGVAGALMAVPILMTFKIVCDHVPSLAPVSELLQA